MAFGYACAFCTILCYFISSNISSSTNSPFLLVRPAGLPLRNRSGPPTVFRALKGRGLPQTALPSAKGRAMPALTLRTTPTTPTALA